MRKQVELLLIGRVKTETNCHRAAACKVSTHLNRAQSRCLRSGNSESHLKRTETGLCRVETLVAAQALTCRHMPVQA